MANITEKALLVRLFIGGWTGYVKDRKTASDVVERNAAQCDAVAVAKRLVYSDHHDAFKRNANAARMYHYSRTLPWLDGGLRVLPAELYMDYIRQMREFTRLADEHADAFIADYARMADQAKQHLGNLYREEDYPQPERLRRKFVLELSAYPIPDAGDFRVKLGKAEEARLRKEIAGTIETLQEAAMRDLWQRLYDAIGHAHERLSAADNVFRDSLIDNLIELTDLLPKLNVGGDKRLDALTHQARQKLCSNNPDTLRKDVNVRAAVASAADDLMKRIDSYINVMPKAA